jgi:hypothetical protein
MPYATPVKVQTATSAGAASITSDPFDLIGSHSNLAFCVTYTGEFIGNPITVATFGGNALTFGVGNSPAGGAVAEEMWYLDGIIPTSGDTGYIEWAVAPTNAIFSIVEVANTVRAETEAMMRQTGSDGGVAFPASSTLATLGNVSFDRPNQSVSGLFGAMLATCSAIGNLLVAPALSIVTGTQLANTDTGTPPDAISQGIGWTPVTGGADVIEWDGTLPVGGSWCQGIAEVPGTRIVGILRAGGVVPFNPR